MLAVSITPAEVRCVSRASCVRLSKAPPSALNETRAFVICNVVRSPNNLMYLQVCPNLSHGYRAHLTFTCFKEITGTLCKRPCLSCCTVNSVEQSVIPSPSIDKCIIAAEPHCPGVFCARGVTRVHSRCFYLQREIGMTFLQRNSVHFPLQTSCQQRRKPARAGRLHGIHAALRRSSSFN